jgi:hypothetical protein
MPTTEQVLLVGQLQTRLIGLFTLLSVFSSYIFRLSRVIHCHWALLDFE